MVSHSRRRLKVTREKITISTRADLAPGSRFANHGLRSVAPADAEVLGSPNEFRERFDAHLPHDVGAVAFVLMRSTFPLLHSLFPSHAGWGRFKAIGCARSSVG